MLKTVIFDLGNVLVFFDFDKMIDQVSHVSGLSCEMIRELLLQHQLHTAYESGKLSSENMYSIFLHEAPQSFNQEDFFQAASDIFEPNTLIFPLIQSLKKRRLRLILLSNTNPAHYAFLAHRLPILNLFDTKILSYEVGEPKPHQKIYSAAIAAANCAPHECFYTDDIPEYVSAGRACGLKGEVFVDVPTLKAHLEKWSQP